MKDAAVIMAGAAAVGRAININYDGKEKLVEVHAVGPEHARVFQIGGESSRPLPSWALLQLEKILSWRPSDTVSQAPRVAEGYRKGDKQIKELLYEL